MRVGWRCEPCCWPSGRSSTADRDRPGQARPAVKIEEVVGRSMALADGQAVDDVLAIDPPRQLVQTVGMGSGIAVEPGTNRVQRRLFFPLEREDHRPPGT